LTTLSEKAINKNLKNPFENISRNGMASKMSIFSFPHGGRKEQIKAMIIKLRLPPLLFLFTKVHLIT